MNCPPYFLHCICLCFLCSTNILWLRYFHFPPENLLSFSQLAPLLRILLLLLFSYFPSFFILSDDFRCSQCARCWHERGERKLWMLSFVFFGQTTSVEKWMVYFDVCGFCTQRCADNDIHDVCALVIYFVQTHTALTHSQPKWKSDVFRCVRPQSRKISWLEFSNRRSVESISNVPLNVGNDTTPFDMDPFDWKHLIHLPNGPELFESLFHSSTAKHFQYYFFLSIGCWCRPKAQQLRRI